jgi:hypothetical protein
MAKESQILRAELMSLAVGRATIPTCLRAYGVSARYNKKLQQCRSVQQVYSTVCESGCGCGRGRKAMVLQTNPSAWAESSQGMSRADTSLVVTMNDWGQGLYFTACAMRRVERRQKGRRNTDHIYNIYLFVYTYSFSAPISLSVASLPAL